MPAVTAVVVVAVSWEARTWRGRRRGCTHIKQVAIEQERRVRPVTRRVNPNGLVLLEFLFQLFNDYLSSSFTSDNDVDLYERVLMKMYPGPLLHRKLCDGGRMERAQQGGGS